MKSITLLFFGSLFFVSTATLQSQNQTQIKITDEIQKNRLLIFATNQTMNDLDIVLTLEGTGFRQRSGVPRKMRIPARAKVNVLNLVIERDKTPYYTHSIEISEELTGRSLRFEPIEYIKIKPKANITLFIPDNCTNCDEIISQLDESPYIYTKHILADNEEMKTQLAPAFNRTDYSIETTDAAIIMIGGTMYPNLNSFEEINQKLEEL